MSHYNHFQLEVTSLPTYELPFRQGINGWLGGDLAFSLPLDSKKILWLFGDSFVQRDLNTKKRHGAAIINNSIAIQTGSFAAETCELQFYWKNNSEKPQSYFLFEHLPGFLWPLSAVKINNDLYIFLLRIVHQNIEDVFGFRQIGNEMIHIPNSQDSPEKWVMRHIILPWEKRIGTFGSNVLIDQQFLYIYGFRQHQELWFKHLKLIAARIDLRHFTNITDMSHWEYYTGKNDRWSTERQQMGYIFDHSNTEFSITFLPKFKKYAFISNSFIAPNPIIMRLGDTPYGPFSLPLEAYQCPETTWSPHYFCYAGKAHPEFAQNDNELIVTYATNSKILKLCVEDLRIYFPRFIRIIF